MNENVVKKEQLYEGKAKKIFATSDPDLVIMEYKDSATAFNGTKNIFAVVSGDQIVQMVEALKDKGLGELIMILFETIAVGQSY